VIFENFNFCKFTGKLLESKKLIYWTTL